jgi:hypothetical protein
MFLLGVFVFCIVCFIMSRNPLTMRTYSYADFRMSTTYQICPWRLNFYVCDRGDNLGYACVDVMHVVLSLSVD